MRAICRDGRIPLVPLDLLAKLRADRWDCTPAEARERLLREAADEPEKGGTP